MKVAVLGGFGAMAEAALHDLAGDRRVTQVRAVDVNLARAKSILARIPNRRKIVAVKSDLASFNEPVDAVLNCAWYELNLKAMELALKLKAHYVDLGGLYHTTLKQLKLDGQFKKAGRVAVLGCGSTPGITNMMVARMSREFDRIDTVAIYDASHDPTLTEDAFVPPFSIRTMLAEYVQPAPVLKNGRMTDVAAHSEADELEFEKPIGRVKAGTVIHSETATLPGYLKDKGVKNCFFKIVYPESVKRQLALLVGMGFARNGEGIKFLTANALPPSGTPKDFEVLRVRIDGPNKTLTWDCTMRPTKLLSAGAMGVGFAGSIAAMLCCEGRTKIRAGVAAPESALQEQPFFEELKRRKVFSLTATTTEPV